jgi:hypothetical protein
VFDFSVSNVAVAYPTSVLAMLQLHILLPFTGQNTPINRALPVPADWPAFYCSLFSHSCNFLWAVGVQ